LDSISGRAVEIDRFHLEIEASAGDSRNIQKIIEQQRHSVHLPRNDRPRPLALFLLDVIRLEKLHGMADRSQWIAQLVRECGEELILAPVRFAQRLFRALEPADVEIDAGPAGNVSGFSPDGNTLSEDGMI
jgi:hypothetical protein